MVIGGGAVIGEGRREGDPVVMAGPREERRHGQVHFVKILAVDDVRVEIPLVPAARPQRGMIRGRFDFHRPLRREGILLPAEAVFARLVPAGTFQFSVRIPGEVEKTDRLAAVRDPQRLEGGGFAVIQFAPGILFHR
ncbi:hypothetical protein SDC9_169353 [bioreactor metagenome]|uniref:Uncharacterized protein n=1 Tax=bioreactor metagenome TaxID=1076179 RepID=A0A645G528_9ZZZZ